MPGSVGSWNSEMAVSAAVCRTWYVVILREHILIGPLLKFDPYRHLDYRFLFLNFLSIDVDNSILPSHLQSVDRC